MFANLNLRSQGQLFTYICEYIEDTGRADATYTIYNSDDHNTVLIYLDEDSTKYVCNGSYWSIFDEEGWDKFVYNKVPKISYMDLYFPEYSLDIYRKSTGIIRYAIQIKTWIAGKEIVLASHILDRLDAIGASRIRHFVGKRYYEYIRIPIIDPKELAYSDDWENFRKDVCYEQSGTNSIGSTIHISLQAVKEVNGKYVPLERVTSCQNSINIGNKTSDYLSLHISTNTENSLNDGGVQLEPRIMCNLKFNDVYSGDFSEYIKETYGMETFKLKYELVIGNDTDIYATCSSRVIGSDEVNYTLPLTEYSFRKSTILKNGNFTSWVGWKEGINIRASVELYSMDGDEEVAAGTILSNTLPFTPDLYKYFMLNSDYKGIYNINLDEIDMQNINLTAINKIEQVVYNTNNHSDSKSNISFPIFYRRQDVMEVVLHPEVNDTITLNLDEYKNKVDKFSIQVEGVKFTEIGRTTNGVVFKVIGAMLPQKRTEGTYYIIDSESNCVATGEYKYVY